MELKVALKDRVTLAPKAGPAKLLGEVAEEGGRLVRKSPKFFTPVSFGSKLLSPAIGFALGELADPTPISTTQDLTRAEQLPSPTKRLRRDQLDLKRRQGKLSLTERAELSQLEDIVGDEVPRSEQIKKKIGFTTPTNTEAVDTSKTLYHGTKAPINKLSDADPNQFGKVSAVYGEGLYLTDNPDVAKSYSVRKGRGEPGKVFAGKVKDVKLLDLDKELPDDAKKVFSGILNDMTDDPPKSWLGTDVYEHLKDAMEYNELTTTEAREEFQNLNDTLFKAGYRGLKHRGGKITKSPLGEHNVTILFQDPYTLKIDALEDTEIGKTTGGVVGSEGEKFYHGTPDPSIKDVSQLDVGKATRTDFGNIGQGIYITPKKYLAEAYSVQGKNRGNVIEVNPKVKNPKSILYDENFKSRIEGFANEVGVKAKPKWVGSGNQSIEFSKELSQKAKEAGFDSIKMVNPDNSTVEMVVFDKALLQQNKLRQPLKDRGE